MRDSVTEGSAASGGPRLGAHMSIAGGMERAVERAVAVGARALQVFVKSSNRWAARPFAEGEVSRFREAALAARISAHTLAHASYLVNLASPDDDLWRRSIASLAEEIGRCAELRIPYLVVHPGSHVGSGEREGLERVGRALDLLLGPRGGATTARGFRLLLETTAGQGSSLGCSFEHLAWILARARSTGRLGVCFDTCHVFAAGYEIRDARSYAETMRVLDRTVGLDRVLAFHLNDSKGDLGSRLDRHEHIGKGRLGPEPFRRILNDRRFRGRPMVLETPKGEDLEEDRENLARLRAMVGR
mgnify:CR=1 FL=1